MADIEIKGTIVANDDKWIYEYFDIGAVCPKDVSGILREAAGEDVTIQINSGGGDVFAGNEIYYLLNGYQAKKTADIIFAASAATIIACAGDTVRAVPGAQYMIHNVSSMQSGDHRDMDHMAQILRNANRSICNIYRLKTGLSEKELLKLMNEETWMDATKAREHGFVDEIIGDNGMLSTVQPLGLYNSTAQILSEEVKEKIRNTVKNPASLGNRAGADFFIQQETLKLLRMRGETRNEKKI